MVVPGRWPRAARCYPPPLSLLYLYFLFSSLLFSSSRLQESSSSRELTPVMFCIKSRQIPFVSTGIYLLNLVLLYVYICLNSLSVVWSSSYCERQDSQEDGRMGLYWPALSVCVGACSCALTEAPVLIERGIFFSCYNKFTRNNLNWGSHAVLEQN